MAQRIVLNNARIHNVLIVQRRPGWTKADALKAVADADKGIVYVK